jgi:hypothetical protein
LSKAPPPTLEHDVTLIEKFLAELLAEFPGGGGGGEAQVETVAIAIKGPQTAGIPITFPMPFDGVLVAVNGSVTGGIISKGPLTWVGIPASKWSSNPALCVAFGSSQSAQSQIKLRMTFKAGDLLCVDTSGGLGTLEYIVALFEPIIGLT